MRIAVIMHNSKFAEKEGMQLMKILFLPGLAGFPRTGEQNKAKKAQGITKIAFICIEDTRGTAAFFVDKKKTIS